MVGAGIVGSRITVKLISLILIQANQSYCTTPLFPPANIPLLHPTSQCLIKPIYRGVFRGRGKKNKFDPYTSKPVLQYHFTLSTSQSLLLDLTFMKNPGSRSDPKKTRTRIRPKFDLFFFHLISSYIIDILSDYIIIMYYPGDGSEA